MLKLHRLEISGFKTFVEPAVLEFSGGITAIVGPNGCGKSNVADAVTWVLGERSAKSLRGATMEDVIFNGASGRKPLGMAEARLTLVTDPDFAGAEDGRLELGRRIDRSGEGEYFVNGRRRRLMDVRDLLMDTGLGLRAYSVIEQGRIGMILSGKPQERRRLLEEAAGITRYKERKRVAEVKLEEALVNLHRLDDIVAELERSLRSLQRQAGAARRYEQRRQELQELAERVLCGRWARHSLALEASRQSVEQAQALEAERTARLHQAESALVAARRELDDAAETLGRRHQRNAELAARIEGRQEFLRSARSRLEDALERLTAGNALAGQRTTMLAERRTARGALEEACRALEAEHQTAASEVDLDAGDLEAAEQEVAFAEQALGLQRSELLASLQRLNDLRSQRHREQIEWERGELRRQQLVAERSERDQRLRRTREDLAQAAAEVERQGAAETAARTHLQAAQAAEAAVERRLREATQTWQEAEHAVASARQRRDLLEANQRAEGERRERLRSDIEAAGIPEASLVGDALNAPAGFESSVDEALGTWTDAAVVPATADPLAVLDQLGPGALLLEPGEPDTALPPELQTRRLDLGLPAEQAQALPPLLRADDEDEARMLARRHPGWLFLTPRLVACGGLLRRPHGADHPGRLATGRQIRELAARVAELEERGRLCAAAVEEAEQEATRHASAVEAATGELNRVTPELAVARARHEDLVAQSRRLDLEATTLNTEAEEVARELARLTATLEQLDREAAECERQHANHEETFDRLRAELDAARERRGSLRTAGTGRQGRLALIGERLVAQRSLLERHDAEIADGERQQAAWTEEAQHLEHRREELEQALATAEVELQESLDGRAESETAVQHAQERSSELRERVTALELEVKEARTERESAQAALSEERVARAALQQESRHFEEEFRARGTATPPAAEATQIPDDLDALERELAGLREKLEAMGPVNLLAAEESREQQERLDFIRTQRDDVQQSVERLRRTIREINQTSTERFRATFEEVNRAFGQTFVDLFQGGEAQMRLLDEDDLLDSGIEILARPPGKRPQNIMLLSGGEKALTAIALLFALFRTKPSPFCILDEVDAPLDDVNTLRFVQLLQRMAEETQFIVITHNKLTMEAASRLYGVTMQERGVSSIVAVELDRLQPAVAGEETSRAASA